jgi:hypothetical protein
MQTRAVGLPEITGLIVTVLLTHLLQSLFTLPRMLVEVMFMNLPWDDVGDPMRFHWLVFAVLDFVFALFVGRLAMSGCRFIVPGANRSSVFILASIFALVFALAFALAEAIWRLNIPGMFVPPPNDAGYALPGWIIAYYFSISTAERARLTTPAAGTLAAVTVVMAIGLPLLPMRVLPAVNQSYMPHVDQTFHPALNGGSVPQPADSNAIPTFTPVPVSSPPGQ